LSSCLIISPDSFVGNSIISVCNDVEMHANGLAMKRGGFRSA